MSQKLFISFLSRFELELRKAWEFESNWAMYEPKPIDTSGITLPPELSALTERLAENAHDIWAQQRLDEGWTYGSRRDDQAKTHPCLVSYEQLPDSEKDYDRNAAMKTLKALMALGYRMVKVD